MSGLAEHITFRPIRRVPDDPGGQLETDRRCNRASVERGRAAFRFAKPVRQTPIFSRRSAKKEAGGIVLSGHSVVVLVESQDWSSDTSALTERDVKLQGGGNYNMKGFIAASLAMASRFAASTLQRPHHSAFAYDEEVGCLGGHALVAELAKAGVRPCGDRRRSSASRPR